MNQEYIRERQVRVEGVQSSGEHTLPDYQGDVKKVLYSSAKAQDGGRFQGRDMLECVGVVVYKIVYLDAEGRITPVSFTTDYEYSTKCPDEGYIDSDVQTRVANFSLRLMGPRRFSAKAQLEADLLVTEDGEYAVDGEHEGHELEIERESVSVATASYKTSSERELAEELIHLEGAIVDEVEVLLHSAEPRAIGIQKADGGAEIKAEIAVKVLISCMGEQPRLLECTLDYSEELEMTCPEGAILVPRVSIISERVSVNPLEDGVSVVVNVLAESSVCAHVNTEVSLVKDCYSTERGIETVAGEYQYTEYLGTSIINERYSYTQPREAVGAENVRNVLYESAKPRIEEISEGDGGLEIRGMMQFSAIACEVAEDGTPTYSPLRFETPFAINVNYNVQIPESSRNIISLELDSAHVELDGNGVNCTGVISGAASLYAGRREPCITSATLTDESFECSSNTVSVYYPRQGESLFEVAKKFHTTTIALAKDNELTEQVFSMQNKPDGLCGVDYLIVNSMGK